MTDPTVSTGAEFGRGEYARPINVPGVAGCVAGCVGSEFANSMGDGLFRKGVRSACSWVSPWPRLDTPDLVSSIVDDRAGRAFAPVLLRGRLIDAGDKAGDGIEKPLLESCMALEMDSMAPRDGDECKLPPRFRPCHTFLGLCTGFINGDGLTREILLSVPLLRRSGGRCSADKVGDGVME